MLINQWLYLPQQEISARIAGKARGIQIKAPTTDASVDTAAVPTDSRPKQPPSKPTGSMAPREFAFAKLLSFPEISGFDRRPLSQKRQISESSSQPFHHRVNHPR